MIEHPVSVSHLFVVNGFAKKILLSSMCMTLGLLDDWSKPRVRF